MQRKGIGQTKPGKIYKRLPDINMSFFKHESEVREFNTWHIAIKILEIKSLKLKANLRKLKTEVGICRNYGQGHLGG